MYILISNTHVMCTVRYMQVGCFVIEDGDWNGVKRVMSQNEISPVNRQQ